MSDEQLPTLDPRELAAVLDAALTRFERDLLSRVGPLAPATEERLATIARRAADARASIAAMALATERP